MSRIAIWRSAWSFASRSRICAWMVTSRAVVGSSAMRTSGSAASAQAIMTRCLSPPDNWNGYSSQRRAASGMPTASSNASARARTASPVSAVWRSMTSVIWRPTVRTGLSAVDGSWKIIATRRPRTARIAASGSASRSWPSSRTRPSAMRPASGSRRISDSAVIDLPLPDSPTSAKHSPLRSLMSTPSTARSSPLGVSRYVLRFATSSTGLFTCAPVDRSRRAPRRRTGWPPGPART